MKAAVIAVVLIASTANAQQRDSVQIPLPGPGILHGFVSDSADRPLDGAEVTIASLRLSTLTGADGSFRFEHIKPESEIGNDIVDWRVLGVDDVAAQFKADLPVDVLTFGD